MTCVCRILIKITYLLTYSSASFRFTRTTASMNRPIPVQQLFITRRYRYHWPLHSACHVQLIFRTQSSARWSCRGKKGKDKVWVVWIRNKQH